jgi:L-asparaginase
MVTAKPRILLVTTGGTLSMLKNEEGLLIPQKNIDGLLAKVPEVENLARVDILPLANIDSSNIQPELWLAIGQAIYERMDRYDGFVVSHGTDTLCYTSAALSFILQELPKPVVVTGAQLSVENIGTDARINLVNAVRVAISDIAEVSVVFGTQIILGTRAKKTSVFDLQAITSVKSIPLGNIGLSIKFNMDVRKRGPRKVLHQPFMNTNVCRIGVYPGFKPAILDYLASTHDGIVIEGYGAGNIPTDSHSLIPSIKNATKNNVPVVVCTPCIIGSTQMELYQVGQAALDAGAIPAMDMTPETTLVKLMWILGQTGDLKTVGSMMQKCFAGELFEN